MDATYKSYIKNLANSGANTVFYNSGPRHGAVVMSTIFDSAKDRIKICAGSFSGEISKDGEYKKSLIGFLLEKKGKLEVLLQKDSLEENGTPELFSLLKFCLRIEPGCVVVKQHEDMFVDNDKEVHFTIADDKMYRLETNIKSFEASGSFNDNETCKGLNILFDEAFNNETTEVIDLFASSTQNFYKVPGLVEALAAVTSAGSAAVKMS